jgi:hypothetical protein
MDELRQCPHGYAVCNPCVTQLEGETQVLREEMEASAASTGYLTTCREGLAATLALSVAKLREHHDRWKQAFEDRDRTCKLFEADVTRLMLQVSQLKQALTKANSSGT